MNSTIDNPSIPYVGALPLPLQNGHLIRIQGTVNSSATCFSVNLQCGENSVLRPDVALHLSPVFSPPPRLVRNSFQNQQWGPEESHGPFFPFSVRQEFEILILVENDEYKIAVNGQHFCEFSHRIPLHSVSHLAIDGDVTINTIKFESFQGVQASSPSATAPIGFVDPEEIVVKSSAGAQLGAPPPSSPYGAPSLPYPSGNTMIGPQPTYGPTSPTQAYGPPGGNNPYGPYPGNNPYGPPAGSPYGGSSPSHSYGPPMNNPYGPPASGGGYPPYGGYPSQQGGFPMQSGGYPGQQGGYPGGYPGPQGGYPGGYPGQPGGYPYPGQPGGYPYPGTSVVYPGQEKSKDSSGGLAGLTALGTALAGGIGGALMGSKQGKHGSSPNPASSFLGGGPASMLASGLLGSGAGGKLGDLLKKF